MNKKRIFGAALSLCAAMSMYAGTYTFKIANPTEGAKIEINWCATGEMSKVDVVNGVATVSKSGFASQYGPYSELRC